MKSTLLTPVKLLPSKTHVNLSVEILANTLLHVEWQLCPPIYSINVDHCPRSTKDHKLICTYLHYNNFLQYQLITAVKL